MQKPDMHKNLAKTINDENKYSSSNTILVYVYIQEFSPQKLLFLSGKNVKLKILEKKLIYMYILYIHSNNKFTKNIYANMYVFHSVYCVRISIIITATDPLKINHSFLCNRPQCIVIFKPVYFPVKEENKLKKVK